MTSLSPWRYCYNPHPPPLLPPPSPGSPGPAPARERAGAARGGRRRPVRGVPVLRRGGGGVGPRRALCAVAPEGCAGRARCEGPGASAASPTKGGCGRTKCVVPRPGARRAARRPLGAFAPRRNAAFVSAAAARPCVSQREISEGRWQMPAAELCPTSPVTGNCSPRVNGAVPWGPGQGETGADISDDRYIFTFFHPHPDFTWS